MIDIDKIRLAFRGWLNTAGVDLDVFIWENRPSAVEEEDTIVEEFIETFAESTNTALDSVVYGMVTYYVMPKKGIGTVGTLVKQIGDVFQPSLRKGVAVDTTITVCVERCYAGTPTDFQSDTASRWRIPVRVEFRAYEND
jgi:hypothetical protein